MEPAASLPVELSWNNTSKKKTQTFDANKDDVFVWEHAAVSERGDVDAQRTGGVIATLHEACGCNATRTEWHFEFHPSKKQKKKNEKIKTPN